MALASKMAWGEVSVGGTSSVSIDYSSAGFTSVPEVIATYGGTGSNVSGDNGIPKVYDKKVGSAKIILSGSRSTTRKINWIAVGV